MRIVDDEFSGHPDSGPDAVDPSSIDVVHKGNSLSVTWDAPVGAATYDLTYYRGNRAHARAAWNRTGTSLNITCDIRAGAGASASGLTLIETWRGPRYSALYVNAGSAGFAVELPPFAGIDAETLGVLSGTLADAAPERCTVQEIH